MKPCGQVLIIEDDDASRNTLQILFETQGIPSVCASDGKDALELLRVIPEPTTIVVDLQMPVMDGRTFIAKLRESKLAPNSQIIVLTTSRLSVVTEGVSHWFTKPVNFDELLAAVESAGEERAS
jgi:DNA-binding response OmpR family regulator